jgi:Large polyvalent protein associated domain 23
MLTTTLAVFVFAKVVLTGDVSASYLDERHKSLSTELRTLEGEARLAQVSTAVAKAGDEHHKWLWRNIIFSGENSRTADRPALSRAKQMERKVDAAEMWKKTGWEKDKAGSWVYEISDEDAKIRAMPDLKKLEPGEHAIVRLGDLLDHPFLFKAYPHLAEILVKVYNAAQVQNEDDPGDAYEATTTPARFWRPASIEIAGRIHNFLPTLMHEVQHILEPYENLDYGPYTADYNERIGEVRARNVERRLRMTTGARRRQPPHTTQDTPHSKVRISPHRVE